MTAEVSPAQGSETPADAPERPVPPAAWTDGWRPGLGRRLLLAILLFSSCVTLLLTGLQLYLDFRRDVDAIQHRLDEIEASHLPSLAASLWNLDEPLLRAQLRGMLSLPDMHAVEVRETVAGVATPLRIRLEVPGEVAALAREVAIVHQGAGGPRNIGRLRLEISLTPLYRELREKALIILAAQGLKTFLVSFFILYLVYRLVTRHLAALARRLEAYVPGEDAPAFRLARTPPAAGDELQSLLEAFNALQRKLTQSYRDLKEVQSRLEADMAARQRAEATAAHLAYHDPVTDLPNRRRLLERLRHELSLAGRLHHHGAILVIDLDHFKVLNDALGHRAGDALLARVADRLRAGLRDIDLAVRLGGDEFAILLSAQWSSREAAAQAAGEVAEKLRQALREPYPAGGHVHHVTASLGVGLYPDDASDPDTLLKHADTALHHAKADGRDRVRLFEPSMHEAARARHRLDHELRQALLDNHLSLAYQPLLDAHGQLQGAEVLLRWRHPARGWVPPAEFIPVAEESGLILDIGHWVLETALRQIRAWEDDGRLTPAFHLAVNVSPRQFHQPDFPDQARGCLARAGVAPRRLIMEITEGVLLHHTPQALVTLDTLKDLGVRFYVDDFGTGYSSLSYLKRLPVDGVKIDQSFVRDFHEARSGAAIIDAILGLARGLGLAVVAEGVETPEQHDALRKRGCDYYQGYLFSRPVPAAEFAACWLPAAAASQAE